MSKEVSRAQLERVIGQLFDQITATQLGLAAVKRAQDSRHTVIEPGSRFEAKDQDGKVTWSLSNDGSGDPVKYVDGPDPAQPEVPEVDVAQGGMVVIVDGYDVHGNIAPADLKHVRVHYSRDPEFAPYVGSYKGQIASAKGQGTFGVSAGLWYVAVQWETKSGKLSEPSEIVTVDVEAPVDAQDIQDTLDEAQERLDEYDEAAQESFTELRTGLAENKTNLASTREDLDEARQTLEPIPARIEAAERNVEEARDTATEASAAAIEANNRAMTRLANGNFESGLDYWSHHNVTLTETAHSGLQAAQINGWLRPGSSFPVVADQIWELSLYHQYDVTVEFQALDGDQRATLSTHHLDGDSTWADSGTLRVTIPADVHMLSFTITGTSAIVDDITLRDVTDVVRLERAANANRQKAEQAISELAVLQLAVDGEGGLKDRLQSAETVLETKADTAALDQLDQKLRTDLAAFEAHYTRVWRQPTPPPAGTSYEWAGERHASESIKRVDGVEVARNLIATPYPNVTNNSYLTVELPFGQDPPQDGETVTLFAKGELGEGKVAFYVYNSGGSLNIPSLHLWRSSQGEDGVFRVRGEWRTGVTSNTYLRLYAAQSSVVAESSIEWVMLVRGEYDGPYFDGSTASDRAHDLWYNNDGVPHEWVNGEGWVVLDDARIKDLADRVGGTEQRLEDAEEGLEEALEGPIDHDRLRVGTGAFDEAFASKLIADHATIINAAMRNLSVEEKLLFAEAIGEQIWAKLGVFDRLQAREGWIGGTLLADGAITAEKITATRELVTKIMGAEWAYIAEQLVVDGDLIADNASIINAAMQSLSVTERLDFVEAFGDEIYSRESITEVLTAGEAWIAGTLLKDNTVDTKNLNVTEEMVAAFARILHLVVDQMDVNKIWADESWQKAGHFGSEDADQQTQVDGQGVTLYRKIDGEFIPAAIFGGGDVRLSFFGNDDEPIGSIAQDGQMSGQNAQFQSYSLAGHDIFGDPEQYEAGRPLLDNFTQRIPGYGYRNMSSLTRNTQDWGFLEVQAQLKAGRSYKIEIPPFLVSADKPYFLRVRYTLDGSSPNWTSTNLFTQQSATQTLTGAGVINVEEDSQFRMIMFVSANSTGISFPSYGADVYVLVTDLGPSPEGIGVVRDATRTDHDNQPLVRDYSTGWPLGWHQHYNNGAPYDDFWRDHLLQGAVSGSMQASTVWGGYQATTATVGSTTAAELGRTIPQALSGGATLTSGTIRLTGRSTASAQGTYFRLFWHIAGSAPTVLPVGDRDSDSYIGATTIQHGQTEYFDLPQACLDAFKAGQPVAFSIQAAEGNTLPYAAIQNRDDWLGPIVALHYTR